MTVVIPLAHVTAADGARVGGKAVALAELARRGVSVAVGACVPVECYREFVRVTGLVDRIGLELNRKRFADMRWEEIWDVALRIRNHFLRADFPPRLRDPLAAAVEQHFGKTAVIVRSSALGEDSGGASFAGLHESYVNVCGVDAILEHVRLVWASLWSDRALLYRRELGLEVADSAMAVLIQRLVRGDRSGVAFGVHPQRPDRAVVEAVYGQNQGLVDGLVAPDRWILDRITGQILEHQPVERRWRLVPAGAGTERQALPTALRRKPPLDEAEVRRVHRQVCLAEEAFGHPQDVEWTFRGKEFHILQSRPITTAPEGGAADNRAWYLSLTRSLENLKALHTRIETEIVPGMNTAARELAARPFQSLDDAALAAEIRYRLAVYRQWKNVYWDDLIPFAHGIRLFGQFYNDVIRPTDPYAFMSLLADTGLQSIRRNERLGRLAARVRVDTVLAERLKAHAWQQLPPDFLAALDDFLAEFGTPAWGMAERQVLAGVVLEMTKVTDAGPGARVPAAQRDAFLDAVPPARRELAAEILELARHSYRWRDDDNIHLGRVERELRRVLTVGRQRLAEVFGERATSWEADTVADVLTDPTQVPPVDEPAVAAGVGAETALHTEPRQLVGQPAGPGVATATARLIRSPADIGRFQAGDILVCDAVDPNMTFLVPLAAAIVERRGGMLIHGAIIAREYGLPCVTGVPDATRRIHDGDRITVDGYIGVVIVRRQEQTILASRAGGRKTGTGRNMTDG
ncbi:MAG: hypothetical protein JXQ27_17875 [Acidobacteria bacterium]|nr:hypothetical protein [Acidobacteriota bacterium]